MARVPNAVEILPNIWTAWVGCTNVTGRRQTDRQTTDGRAIAYSEREREFTFAKNRILTSRVMWWPEHNKGRRGAKSSRRPVGNNKAWWDRKEGPGTSLRYVSCERDASVSTLQQPGRRQLHAVTRPAFSLIHKAKWPARNATVSDTAVNRRCVFVTVCDRWLTVSACVVWLNTKHDICLIVYYFTQRTTHHNTAKSSIAGKVSQKTRQTNVSTAKDKETHATMSTEPTDGTF